MQCSIYVIVQCYINSVDEQCLKLVPTYGCEQHVVQEQGHEHNEQDETAWTAAPGQQIRPRIVGEQVEQHGEEEEEE